MPSLPILWCCAQIQHFNMPHFLVKLKKKLTPSQRMNELSNQPTPSWSLWQESVALMMLKHEAGCQDVSNSTHLNTPHCLVGAHNLWYVCGCVCVKQHCRQSVQKTQTWKSAGHSQSPPERQSVISQAQCAICCLLCVVLELAHAHTNP